VDEAFVTGLDRIRDRCERDGESRPREAAMWKRAVVCVATLFVAGCASESSIAPAPSTMPTTDDLPLTAGLYVIGLTGFASSEDPLFPPCSPITVPRDGTAITTPVSVSREDAEWVVRAEPAGSGDLEIRLRAVPSALGLDLATGTARGCARDQAYGPHQQVDVRLCVSGINGADAQVEARASYSGRVVTARMTGRFAFSDSAGATGRCSAISMFLRRSGS
jgi:hypothetical protein